MKKTAIVLLGAVMALAMSIQPASAAMNRVELNSAKLVNAERKAAGLKAMNRQACLQRHAEVHAARMARANRLYHRTPSAMRTVMKRCGLRSLGENIAVGRAMKSTQVVPAWMRSSGHRKNILTPGFNRIGAAYQSNANGQRYWIQLYGRA